MVTKTVKKLLRGPKPFKIRFLGTLLMFQDLLLTLGSHRFVNNDRNLTKPVPMERSRSGLSIGTGFVKN